MKTVPARKAAAAPVAIPPYRLTAAALVAMKAAEGEGSRPSFSINAYNGGPIKPSWIYGGVVVIDLAGLRAAEPIAILLDHDARQIVGQSTAVEISASGINLAGIITGALDDPGDPAGKVALHARNGFIWKASVGVMPERIEKVEAGADATVNGKTHAGPLYVIRAGTLDEVSFLSIGADKSATAKVAAAAGKATEMIEFHEWLKAKGFDPATLDETQRDSLLKAYQAEDAAIKARAKAGGGGGDLDAVLGPVRLKAQRREAVHACVAKFAESHPAQIEFVEALGRQAIAEDWTQERLELQYFRELGSNPINNAPRSSAADAEGFADMVEAGLARAGGLDGIERHYSAKTLDALDRSDYRRGVGLRRVLKIAARANGYAGDSDRVNEEMLRAAFRRSGGDDGGGRMRAAAGPSTFDISGVLSNVMNKFIVQYFMGVDSAWAQIAGRANVNDFKQHSYYSLTGDMQYEEVAPGGELKHGKLGEQPYTLQAKTYGKIFQIDRRDLVNDDLGAFTQVARRLGRGGALKLNDVFWRLFLDNAAFFSVANNNYFTGAPTALGVASLETAEANFIKMLDPDGKPMAILPKSLLVPPELKRTGLALLNSTEVRDTTASTKYGTVNTFKGEFSVVTSPYMSAAGYTGASAKKWYLLADPNDVPVILVGFLDGVERPTIEQAMADFDTLGIKMRGYWDFGVALHEPRGGLAMKGEV